MALHSGYDSVGDVTMRPASESIQALAPLPTGVIRSVGLLLASLMFIGCATHPVGRVARVSASKSISPDCRQAHCPTLEKVSLQQVSQSARPPLGWPSLPSLVGQPLAISEATTVRLLAWNELQALAIRGDSTNRLLTDPWACNSDEEPAACLQAALHWQATHAGSLAIARAGEAFLGLQECYLQNELLEQARRGSDRRERMLEKFREHGLPLKVDPRELDRQRLELERQFAQLAREYQAATIGLELLLELTHEPTAPIWPTVTQPNFVFPSDLPACLELAKHKRADRQALLSIQSCLEIVPPEQLTGLGNSLSPWSSLTLPPPPVHWLSCRRSDWEEKARKHLQTQLCTLLAENEKQLTLEVNLAYARRWTASEQLRITEELVASLQSSLADIEQLRSIEPVDVAGFLELEQRLMAAESQRVAATIEQAKAELELAKAIGILPQQD